MLNCEFLLSLTGPNSQFNIHNSPFASPDPITVSGLYANIRGQTDAILAVPFGLIQRGIGSRDES